MGGNLTKGNCADAGFPKDTGTKDTVTAGPCGNLTFEIYEKSGFETAVVAAPSGTYEGSVPFIIDVKVTIDSATSMDMDINVKIQHEEVKCQAEATATSDTAITFPNAANTGDCMGDSLRKQKKDPTKVSLKINPDGTLTFHSQWPDLKLKPKKTNVAADCEDYTHMQESKCAQACLGEKVGECPRKIVVVAGNLTKGNCADAGYPTDTGTTDTVKAGPCGNLTFEIYDKSVSADCEDYTHMQEGKCAQACLGEKVGVCPLKIVVVAGNLTKGNCADAGFPKDTGTKDTVTAGPCGNLTFEIYEKSGFETAVVAAPSGT